MTTGYLSGQHNPTLWIQCSPAGTPGGAVPKVWWSQIVKGFKSQDHTLEPDLELQWEPVQLVQNWWNVFFMGDPHKDPQGHILDCIQWNINALLLVPIKFNEGERSRGSNDISPPAMAGFCSCPVTGCKQKVPTRLSALAHSLNAHEHSSYQERDQGNKTLGTLVTMRPVKAGRSRELFS